MAKANHRSTTVRGDHIDLAVFESGPSDAATVVCVHGYPDCHSVWDGVVEVLAERFHVVTYDVRGAGVSDVPAGRDGYAIDHLIADLAAVVEATSPDRPVHLVAHDWGSIQCWDALVDERLAGRIATYTSMSGPSLHHVGAWMRARRRLAPRAIGQLLRQGVKSWYVAFFQIPKLAEWGWRTVVPRSFTRYLHRVEGVPEGGGHPSPTLADDGRRGVDLYRANVPGILADPAPRTTDVPVLLVIARRDRYVTPGLLADTERWAPALTRVDLDAGHWAQVADPEGFAALVEDFIARQSDGASPGGSEG